jgi:hypothetical protein
MSDAVVLLGCWTAGKSSLVKRLRDKVSASVTFIDSDEFVSSTYAGSLYNIYLAYAERSGLDCAREYIDLQERLLLAKLLSMPKPYVLAAGPLLPTREPIWNVFLNHVQPSRRALPGTEKAQKKSTKSRTGSLLGLRLLGRRLTHESQSKYWLVGGAQ